MGTASWEPGNRAQWDFGCSNLLRAYVVGEKPHQISIKSVQDWGTGAQGQRLGGADAAPTDARLAALAAAERRQVPQGVAPERAKEMTEQRQRDAGHGNGTNLGY